MTRMERFTQNSRDAMNLAVDEAWDSNKAEILPGHILVGVAGVEDGTAARALRNLGIHPEHIRAAWPGEVSAVGISIEQATRARLAPSCNDLLIRAIGEARSLQHRYISTGHLLLAWLAGETVDQTGVLQTLGVDAESLRLEATRCLETKFDPHLD